MNTQPKKLINKTKNSELASDVKIADSFIDRLVGLLGQTNLPLGKSLWIKRCTSIHTFFMKFTIDAVFVDKNLIVKKKVSGMKPWRHTTLSWQAASVFELPAGTIQKSKTEVGDQLDVVD